MKLILILALAITLQAKTIWIIETSNILGRCTIERNDIVILPYDIRITIPNHIKVVQCNSQKCVDYTVNRYKELYRTNGIGVQIVK